MATLDDLARVRRRVDVPHRGRRVHPLARRRAPSPRARRGRRDRAQAAAARRGARRARGRRGRRRARGRELDDGDVGRDRRGCRARPRRSPSCRTRAAWPRSARCAGDVTHATAGAGRRRDAGAGGRRPTPTCSRATRRTRRAGERRVSGCSRWHACPAPAITSTRDVGDHARPCGRAMSTYLVSSAPTISSTGIRSSPSRSQFDGCAPWPSTRSWWVRRSTVFARAASSMPGAVRRQRGEQRLREPALEERVDAVALDLLREALVGVAPARRARRRRRCRATRSPAPAARTDVGPVERELQAQPAALRVADVRGSCRRCRRWPSAVATKSTSSSARRSATASRRSYADQRDPTTPASG